MARYTLTAELNGEQKSAPLDARNDGEAMMEAISTILSRAFDDKQGAWALGKITLTDSTGNLIGEMPAK